MTRAFAIIVVMLVATLPVIGLELPPLEDLMSDSEMEVTGVVKLTQDEKQALREWLEVFVDQDAKFAARRYEKQRKQETRQIDRQSSAEQTLVPSSGGGESNRPELATSAKNEMQEPETKNRFDKSVARIVGDFSGWRGKTLFKLDNGETWQQRRADSVRRTKIISNPEVRIKRNVMGFYVMEIPAAKVRVPVTRID